MNKLRTSWSFIQFMVWWLWGHTQTVSESVSKSDKISYKYNWESTHTAILYVSLYPTLCPILSVLDLILSDADVRFLIYSTIVSFKNYITHSLLVWFSQFKRLYKGIDEQNKKQRSVCKYCVQNTVWTQKCMMNEAKVCA